MRRRGGERVGHSATTAHFCAAFPFLAQAALPAPGVYIGADAYGGGFTYDPWALYPRLLPGPNMLVLGGIGSRKSSLVKTYLYRQVLHRRQAWVLDPKGEYGPLARALGVAPIALAPGGEVRLNPISPRGGREGQLSLLRSVAQAALRRELGPEEDAGLRVALDTVSEECGGREPTLPMVVAALLRPREAMVAGVSAAGPEEFAAANRSSALALQRLCEGDLRGMFDGPTSADLDLDAPLVVLDLSAVRDSAALGILMTCAGAWQQAILAERKRAAESDGVAGAKLISVVEEGWRLTSHIGAAEWLQENFKLCRGWGVQNVLVVHRLSDLGASGAADSREARIAEGLLADADTKVIYRQSPDQAEALRSRLGLGATEAELTTTLRPGEALWVVGRHSFLVQHHVSAPERRLIYTDWRMAEGSLPAAA
ncbi:MAG TPA: hypothetical protein VFI63_03305 [Solirubrobacterales bacterium]|nr:hypothetical protein [Solirubrobacterales bacterium]